MLSNLLSKNKQFVYLILVGIFILLFTAFNWQLNFEIQSLISVGLIISIILYSQWTVSKILAFKPSNYFAWFSFLWLFVFGVDIENMQFYFAFFLIQLCVIQLLSWRYNQASAFNAFDIGFFSLISLIFEPTFILFPMVFLLNYIILGKSALAQIITCILGVITAILIGFEVGLILDLHFIADKILTDLIPEGKAWQLSELWIVPSFIIVVLGISDYISNINKQKPEKKSVLYFAVLMLVAFSIYMLLYGSSTHDWALFFIPVSLILHNFLYHFQHRFWKEVFVWLISVTLLLFRFHSYIPIPEFFSEVTF